MEDEVQSWFPAQASGYRERLLLYMRLLLYQDIVSQGSGAAAHIKALRTRMTHTAMNLLTSIQTHSHKYVHLCTYIHEL